MRNTYLARGYAARIIGLTIISLMPWAVNPDGQDFEFPLFCGIAIGLAIFALGVIIKARSERHPETMWVKLSNKSTLFAIFSLSCVVGLILGRLFQTELDEKYYDQILVESWSGE